MAWLVAAIWLGVVAFFAGCVAAAMSQHFYKAWGIPTRHWQGWYVSLATFCVLSFFNVYGSVPGGGDWRIAEIDRLIGWMTAGAILSGHAAAYWFVNSRPPKDSGQKEA
ncbi:MAG: hypothetical protein ACXIVL_04930 [Oceanicaulis sp.]